jgi:hypothetical protein
MAKLLITPLPFWMSGGGRLCQVIRHIANHFSIDTAGHQLKFGFTVSKVVKVKLNQNKVN